MVGKKYKWLQEKMRGTSIVACMLVFLVIMLTNCHARNKLSLWIDEAQVNAIIKYPLDLYIIKEGTMTKYLNDVGFMANLPVLEPDVDTVNLTWEAGDELYTYWFDNLKSKNKTILYNPLLSIPSSGIIPRGPKIFQMSIPCTGNEEGIAHLVLGLRITDHLNNPIRGSPIKLRLKKQCFQFETSNLCPMPCQNNGRCNQIGECECPQGYHGQFCEVDLCSPKCENNGTCISHDLCLCLDGFFGKRCEKALCNKPCQNGGRCVPSDAPRAGVCWCTSGYFGEACEFSHCVKPCEHGGLCIGHNKCSCKTGYSGNQCEKADGRRRRDTYCARLKGDIKKRCKSKRCKSRHVRVKKSCGSKTGKRLENCKKRQEKLASRCAKKKEKRRQRCIKKKKTFSRKCANVTSNVKKRRSLG